MGWDAGWKEVRACEREYGSPFHEFPLWKEVRERRIKLAKPQTGVLSSGGHDALARPFSDLKNFPGGWGC